MGRIRSVGHKFPTCESLAGSTRLRSDANEAVAARGDGTRACILPRDRRRRPRCEPGRWSWPRLLWLLPSAARLRSRRRPRISLQALRSHGPEPPRGQTPSPGGPPRRRIRRPRGPHTTWACRPYRNRLPRGKAESRPRRRAPERTLLRRFNSRFPSRRRSSTLPSRFHTCRSPGPRAPRVAGCDQPARRCGGGRGHAP